jgi:hypothetical protein
MTDLFSGGRAGTLTLACALAIGGTLPVVARAAEAEATPQDVSSSEIIVMGQRGEDYKVGQLTTVTRTGTDIIRTDPARQGTAARRSEQNFKATADTS